MACKTILLILNKINVLLLALIYRQKQCMKQKRKRKMKKGRKKDFLLTSSLAFFPDNLVMI